MELVFCRMGFDFANLSLLTPSLPALEAAHLVLKHCASAECLIGPSFRALPLPARYDGSVLDVRDVEAP